jgi:hypothetical protein
LKPSKKEAKRLLLELKACNEAHSNPFMYGTEASVNLAADAALIQQTVDGNFKWVFLATETPSMESLKETLKYQNMKRSLLDSVKVIQNAGLLVYGSFIIGFDNDTEDIFNRQIEFITQAAIPNAMGRAPCGASGHAPLQASTRDRPTETGCVCRDKRSMRLHQHCHDTPLPEAL